MFYRASRPPGWAPPCIFAAFDMARVFDFTSDATPTHPRTPFKHIVDGQGWFSSAVLFCNGMKAAVPMVSCGATDSPGQAIFSHPARPPSGQHSRQTTNHTNPPVRPMGFHRPLTLSTVGHVIRPLDMEADWTLQMQCNHRSLLPIFSDPSTSPADSVKPR